MEQELLEELARNEEETIAFVREMLAKHPESTNLAAYISLRREADKNLARYKKDLALLLSSRHTS
jgi:hypothetical protein